MQHARSRRPGVACLALALAAALSARGDEPEGVEFKLPDDCFGMATLDLGGERLRLVVDTGASITLVDARFRQRLGTTIGRDSAGRRQAARSIAVCRNSGGAVGSLKLDLPRLACVDLGSGFRALDLDGLLGMDFLRRYCIDFDWDAQKLRISKRAPGLAGQRVEIKLTYTDDGMPCITANVGEVREVRMGVDTGSSNSAALLTVDQLKIFPDDFEKAMRVRIATVRGSKRRLMTRLPPIEVHGLEARDLLCDVGFVVSRETLLGCGWLRRYRAIFDFPRDTLILVERANPPADEIDMSGLHLRQSGNDLVAQHVEDGLPAKEAGLHGGEIVKAIDGVPAAEMEMWQIRQRLMSGDGKTVRLEVEDGAGRRTVEIKLVRRI